MSSLDELRLSIETKSYIGIKETKIDQLIDDSDISIDGYDVVRRDRNKFGGVLLSIFINPSALK